MVNESLPFHLLPPSFLSSFPLSLCPSLPLSLCPSVPLSLPPSVPPSLPPSLPPSPGPPTSVAPVEVSDIQTTQVRVSWQLPFSHFPLTAYRISLVSLSDSLNQELPPTSSEFQSRQLIISGLMPATNYTVSVRAVNRVGIGPKATAIFITMSVPEFLEDPVEEIRAAEGELVQFRCVASSVPRPNITWENGEGERVTDGAIFNIATEIQGDDSILSVLEFVAVVTVTNGTYRCVADNGLNVTRSELGLVLIGGQCGKIPVTSVDRVPHLYMTHTCSMPCTVVCCTCR